MWITGLPQRTISSMASGVRPATSSIHSRRWSGWSVSSFMPQLMALRVVSLPATARRMKNEPNSAGVRRWPSTSACISAETRSSLRVVEAVLAERLGVAVHRHRRVDEGLERAAELGVAGAEDDVRPVEHVALVGLGHAEHVADDLQGQRRGERLDEVALALLGRRRRRAGGPGRGRSPRWPRRSCGVNARCTSRRSLEWRGSSSTIIEPKNSRVSGESFDNVMPPVELKSCGCRLTVRTSS